MFEASQSLFQRSLARHVSSFILHHSPGTQFEFHPLCPPFVLLHSYLVYFSTPLLTQLTKSLYMYLYTLMRPAPKDMDMSCCKALTPIITRLLCLYLWIIKHCYFHASERSTTYAFASRLSFRRSVEVCVLLIATRADGDRAEPDLSLFPFLSPQPFLLVMRRFTKRRRHRRRTKISFSFSESRCTFYVPCCLLQSLL